ncbi:MAG: sigma 54-interacting transcriptional regulator [Clostridia bacterium]|nr:sigma 54-interacting transcriptional regulator [Clostridia bacterium]
MKPILIVTSSPDYIDPLLKICIESGVSADVLPFEPDSVISGVNAYFHDSIGVIITRGQLSEILKTQQHFPLIEVTLSGDEMAAILVRASQRMGCPRTIALIGSPNLFPDPAPIASLSGTRIRLYPAASSSDTVEAVRAAKADGAELIIGDAQTCAIAQGEGLPCESIGLSENSIVKALGNAVHLSEILLRDQRHMQEMRLLLQHSSDAIIRLNAEGEILFANPRAEKAMGCPEQTVHGTKLLELDGLSPSPALVRALELKRDNYAVVLQFGQASYVANVASMTFEGQHDGFIISMQEFAAIDNLDERVRQERHRRGFVAKARFENFPCKSPKMRALIECAETYAQYDVPILITGEPRLAKSRLAECIHNASLRRKNPFVSVDISTIQPENQFDVLFGRRTGRDIGLVSTAHEGTLFLLDVHMLEPDCQRQLLSILRKGTFQRKDSAEPIPASVRLICSTFVDLLKLAREDRWMWQLANTLLGLTLPMPPIREIPEDIPAYVTEYLDLAAKKFKKQVHLTDEAMTHLCRYPWPSNLRDIEYFCMRAVMLAPEPEISLAFIRERLLPDLDQGESEQQIHIVADQEELRIRRILHETGNNRNIAAQQLGMSRSTLWRKMHKYGID